MPLRLESGLLECVMCARYTPVTPLSVATGLCRECSRVASRFGGKPVGW